MSADEIASGVRQFIQSTINSVDQLEVLLFLMSNPERSWTAAEVGRRIRVPLQVIESNLMDLHGANLLSRAEDGPEPGYQFAPKSNALAAEVAESLNRAFNERRESLIQLIYTRPLDNIRVFADSFRLKKEDS